MLPRYQDRFHGGRVLAEHLKGYTGRADVLVLALPRGGVPVGYEVARALDAPLDVFVVRKLGVPGEEELAMGAIAPGGVRVLNRDVVESLGITPDMIDEVARHEQQVLDQRLREYRGERPLPTVEGKIVILVDDGLATGATMRAAAAAVRQQHPQRVIVAVPVAAAETCGELRREVDEVVCAMTPWPFRAVGLWYEDFAQTSDEEVRELLERAEKQAGAAGRR